MYIAEDIKRHGREHADRKKAVFTLFAELMRSISPAGLQAIKTYIHAEKVNDYEVEVDRRAKQRAQAEYIQAERNEIRERRRRRQQRQAKTALKLQAMAAATTSTASAGSSSAAGGIVTRAKASKSKTKATTTEEEDETATRDGVGAPSAAVASEGTSTAVGASSAAATPAATVPATLPPPAPVVKFVAPEDSDTDNESIPPNDSDLLELIADFGDVPDPEDAWNEFRARCNALELHRAVKMTHVVRRSGNKVSDFNQASQKYWMLKMRPHQTLDRYHQIWTETVFFLL